MAVTQIHAIKVTLNKAIAYISTPAKTDDKMLISGFHCTPEMAAYEFEYTKRAAQCQGGRLAYHMIQSFAPGEVDYNTAHEIGKQFADELLKNNYEYIIATHTDRGHCHNHIIFNSVSFIELKKFHGASNIFHKIARISDKLCQENNLSVVEPNENKGKCYKEYTADKSCKSWKTQLRETIDRCIIKAKDWDDFLKLMQAEDYEIKQGKHISFRAKDQTRFTRSKTLGGRYSESRIKAMLSGQRDVAPKIIPATSANSKPLRVSLIVDIENCIKAQQSAGYAYWADMHNLKMAAITVNYLTDNKLWYGEDITAKQDEVKDKRDSSLARIQVVEKRIKQLNSQIKDLDTYRKNKTVVDKLDSVVFKDKYKREHESEFILFNAAKQSLKAHFPNGKYPLIKELRAEIKELYSEKNALYTDYYSAKDEHSTLTTMKSNVDFILGREQTLEQERIVQNHRDEQNKDKSKNSLE